MYRIIIEDAGANISEQIVTNDQKIFDSVVKSIDLSVENFVYEEGLILSCNFSSLRDELKLLGKKLTEKQVEDNKLHFKEKWLNEKWKNG